MTSFQRNFDWQEKFLPHIKQIVGPLLLEEAPFELDTQEATDLLILRAKDMRIGCRVRRAKYLRDYPYDFTLRARSATGAKTELQKVTDGWGDWLFYGFAEHDELKAISQWAVIDLAHWRSHMIRHKKKIRSGVRENGDGTMLAWFDLRTFPPVPPILVASNFDVPFKKAGAEVHEQEAWKPGTTPDMPPDWRADA